jgi:hypothetical protein
MDTDEVVVDESEIKEGFEIEADEPIDDELIPAVDDGLLPVDDDGSLSEKGEEEEDAELFNEYLFGDDANAM